MEPVIYEQADPRWRPALESLLQSCRLPVEDLPDELQGFTLALDQGLAVVGSVGIERVGPYGLLRSFAVYETFRKSGVGQHLYEKALDFARNTSIRELWLITTSADEYFARRGFERIERADVPPEISGTMQFSALCPASSTVMRKRI